MFKKIDEKNVEFILKKEKIPKFELKKTFELQNFGKK